MLNKPISVVKKETIETASHIGIMFKKEFVINPSLYQLGIWVIK